MAKTMTADGLESATARILEAAGSLPAEARQGAANPVLANLSRHDSHRVGMVPRYVDAVAEGGVNRVLGNRSGHDSHGVGMVPRYVDAVAEGGLRPNAAVKINLDAGQLLALDGQHGYGQIVGVQAMELGIARAQQHGSCIVALAHAHHLGRIGHFAELATAQALVALHFVNVLSRPVVAPWD